MSRLRSEGTEPTPKQIRRIRWQTAVKSIGHVTVLGSRRAIMSSFHELPMKLHVRLAACLLQLMLFFYLPFMVRAMSLLNCVQLGKGLKHEISILQVNQSIECHTGEHRLLFYVSLVVLIAYGFIFPIALFARLSARRCVQEHELVRSRAISRAVSERVRRISDTGVGVIRRGTSWARLLYAPPVLLRAKKVYTPDPNDAAEVQFGMALSTGDIIRFDEKSTEVTTDSATGKRLVLKGGEGGVKNEGGGGETAWHGGFHNQLMGEEGDFPEGAVEQITCLSVNWNKDVAWDDTMSSVYRPLKVNCFWWIPAELGLRLAMTYLFVMGRRYDGSFELGFITPIIGVPAQE